MAIKVGGTTVVDDSRQLSNIASVDATTVAALGAAGVGGAAKATLTASENITAGDIVQILTNGQLEKVASSVTSTTQDLTLDPNVDAVNEYENIDVDFHPTDPNKFAIVYNQPSNGYPYLEIGTISNGQITMGSAVNFIANSIRLDGLQVRWCLSTADRLTVGYTTTSSSITYTKQYDVSGTTPTFVGGTEMMRDSWYVHFKMCAIPNSDDMLVYARHMNSNNEAHAQRWVATGGTGPAVTLGINSSNDHTSAIVFDPTDNTKFMAMGRSLQSGYYRTFVSYNSISGNAITNLSVLEMVDTNGSKNFSTRERGYLVYEPNSGDWITIFGVTNGTNANTLTANAMYINNNTVTARGNATVLISGAVYDGSHWRAEADKNFDSGTIIFGSSNGNPRINKVIYNGSNSFSSVTSETLSFANMNYNNFAVATNNNATTNAYFIYLTCPGGTSEKRVLNLGEFTVDITTTTLDADKLQGIAQENITSGATGDVLFQGIDETQTGLTPSSKYYVQIDGTLGTSAPSSSYDSVLIGQAVATDKLLMNKGI